MDVVERVQAAMAAGARTRKEIALATHMDAGTVDAAVDVLVRTGLIDVHALAFACGAGGCGNCAQDAACAPRAVPVRMRAAGTRQPE